MKSFGFQNLEIYQLAKSLAIENYKITGSFSNNEKFALVQQMNRAAISISSNIAEGYAREGSKDKCHFFNIAYGSLMELVCQYEISKDLAYINENQYEDFIRRAYDLAVKISNFRKYIISK